jgi:hypothetical protein
MKIFQKINIVLVTVLSLASGVAKLMQLPDEVKFFQDTFQDAGLSLNLMLILGVAQLVGGILLIFEKVRIPGVVLVAVSFFMSSMMIFNSGNIQFGVFSLLPVLMALLIAIKANGQGNNIIISE